MKEFEKLLFEDTKRKENVKALNEVKLGLFEQKEEETFDFTNYTLMTYNKKYKGLYDLYQNKETFELVYVCPLLENNKGDDSERKDLKPYAYDVLYLEYLDAESYELVRKAAIHEKSKAIDILYCASWVIYAVFLLFTLVSIILTQTSAQGFVNIVLINGSLIAGCAILTLLLLIVNIQYRKFKSQ